MTLAPLDNRALANLTGPLDANLRQIEAALDVAITHRGGSFTIVGEPDAGRRAPAKRCSASTRRRKSRCRSTTSSSAWSRSRRRSRRSRAATADDGSPHAAHAAARPARPHAEPGRVPEGHHRATTSRSASDPRERARRTSRWRAPSTRSSATR